MDCTEKQYSLNNECHPCLECEPGLEPSEDCGYGNGRSARCTPCSLKSYKEDWGHHNCRFCQSCKHLNRHEKSSCTSRRNAVCGECLPGFYSKMRVDGLQDWECLPCGPTSPSGQQCRRSHGDDVEKDSNLGMPPQNRTAADNVSVVLVTMAITLSVVLLIYFRQTILRKLFKGCLDVKSKSQTDMESAACRGNRVTLNLKQEQQIPADYRTRGDEFDLLECVTVPPQHPPPHACGQTSELQPPAPDGTTSYSSSGFESLTSSEQPFNSQEVAAATPAPSPRQRSNVQDVAAATPAPSPRQRSNVQDVAAATPAPSPRQPSDIQEVAVATQEECARPSAFPPSQTAQGHCASEQENYQHVPVECTEMDIHTAASSSLDFLLYCQTGCSSGTQGTRAVAGAQALDGSIHRNRLRDQSWSPSARIEDPLDCCCRIPQQRSCCLSPGHSNRVITAGMADDRDTKTVKCEEKFQANTGCEFEEATPDLDRVPGCDTGPHTPRTEELPAGC